jgi:hypothetical protein
MMTKTIVDMPKAVMRVGRMRWRCAGGWRRGTSDMQAGREMTKGKGVQAGAHRDRIPLIYNDSISPVVDKSNLRRPAH